eukprot:jgi/Undpi1/827/HiC_scaffold_10.g04291.m1
MEEGRREKQEAIGATGASDEDATAAAAVDRGARLVARSSVPGDATTVAAVAPKASQDGRAHASLIHCEVLEESRRELGGAGAGVVMDIHPSDPVDQLDGDGAAATSNGAAAEATADGPSPASAMDVDGDNAVGASGFHQTNITPLLSGPSNIDSTVNLLQSIVNKDIAKLNSGEIAELSPQTMALLSRLYDAISLRAASGSAGSSSGGSGSGESGSGRLKGKSFKGKSPEGDKSPKGVRTGKKRPKCTDPTCKSKDCWRYAGFNLLVVDPDSVWSVSNKTKLGALHLPRGLYGLSNVTLDTPNAKTVYGKSRVLQVLLRMAADPTLSEDALVDLLMDVLADETPCPLSKKETCAKAFSADLSPHQNTLSIAAADDLIAVGHLFSSSAS